MFIRKNLPSGVWAAIIVPRVSETRLQTTCFRGKTLQRAGNFSQWNSSAKLFRDYLVEDNFLAALDEAWSERIFGTNSINIAHKMSVGWESTAPLEDYAPEDLEEFKLNRRSWGLRVKPSRVDLLAPQTHVLTIVYELKSEDGKPITIVHSIYPGFDVGDLYGDVTDREKRVFFDWSHPGVV